MMINPPLVNEKHSNQSPRKFESDGQGLPGDPLQSAVDFIGGGGRTTGEETFGIRHQTAIALLLTALTEANFHHPETGHRFIC